MASKPAQKSGGKKGMSLGLRFAVFCLMVAGVLVFPTTLLICACLVPSFVAAVVDSHPEKTAWVTVGALNFAGTVPVWFELWKNGNDLKESIALVTSTHTYIYAYTAALLGWIIYYNITPLIAGMLVMKSDKRLKDIDKRQRELIRKWGTEVAGVQPPAE